MKFYNIILLIFTVLFLSCETEKKEVTIIGKIIGEIPENIEYTIPINGTWFYGSKQAIKPDSLGNFQINLNIDSPSFITLYIPKKANGTLLLELGETYNITFNLSSNDKKFLVTGKNAEAQNIYNAFPNPEFHINPSKFIKDSIPSVIMSKIKEAKEKEVLLFFELFKNHEISEGFYNLVKLDRDCYYSAVQGSVALYKFGESYRDKNEKLKANSLAILNETFNNKLFTHSSLISSPWFYALTDNFLQYIELKNESFDFEKLIRIHQRESIHTKKIEVSKNYLSEDVLEYFNASYIYFNSWQNKDNSKELITLYDNFENEYPTSKYNKYLTHTVTPIIEFHKKAEEMLFDDKFKFIDNYENIDTFEELAKTLEGKKVYIDIWGTWCAPCKEEFQYKDDLNKLLKSKNTSILYICEGRNSKEKVWQEMIKGYQLEGYHIRTNEKLLADIIKIFGDNGSFYYPRYILIDENGQAIKSVMAKPSELKELAEIIKEL